MLLVPDDHYLRPRRGMNVNDKRKYHTQTNIQHIQIQHTTSNGHTSGATIHNRMQLLLTYLVTQGA